MSEEINPNLSASPLDDVELPDTPGPSRMRLVLFIVLALAIAGGYLAWKHLAGRESTDDAQIEGHIHPVAARVGGTVTRVDVNENRFVNAGDVLVQLDPADYQTAVQRARADLAAAVAGAAGSETDVPITSANTTSVLQQSGASVAEAQASLTASNRMLAAAKARLESAKANVLQVQANYAKAAKDVERFKPLVAKEEISQQQYDAAIAQADALRAGLGAVNAQVAEAEASINVQESFLTRDGARVKQAEAAERRAQTGPQQVAVTRAVAKSAAARVQLAQAALDQAELNLKYTTLRAPVAGIVSSKTVEVGQIIQPGQPLLAVVPSEDIWVVANFKETQLRDMRPGQKVSVSVDSDGHTYDGRVDSISAATGGRFSLLPPENATGNYVKVVQRVPVKIVLDPGQDKEHHLRPGISVEPTVYTR